MNQVWAAGRHSQNLEGSSPQLVVCKRGIASNWPSQSIAISRSRREHTAGLTEGAFLHSADWQKINRGTQWTLWCKGKDAGLMGPETSMNARKAVCSVQWRC
jgi:hypothetical protein